METLVLDGRRYVKASKAASNLGYTSDYVGQLCRSGQVKAHLVGRTWYVDEEELGTHRVEKKRMSRVKAREHAKKTLAQYRAETRIVPQKTYEKVAIRYETDNESLIPEPRKLNVESERTAVSTHKTTQSSSGTEPAYEVENPGEKIIMSGKLDVVDLNEIDTLPDEHTVLMTARINRKVLSPNTKARAAEPLVSDAEQSAEQVVVADIQKTPPEEKNELSVPRQTFTDRLIMNEVNLTSSTDDSVGLAEEEVATIDGQISFIPSSIRTVEENHPVGLLSPIFGLIIPILLSLCSFILEQTISYHADNLGNITYVKAYTVDISGFLSEIGFKI